MLRFQKMNNTALLIDAKDGMSIKLSVQDSPVERLPLGILLILFLSGGGPLYYSFPG